MENKKKLAWTCNDYGTVKMEASTSISPFSEWNAKKNSAVDWLVYVLPVVCMVVCEFRQKSKIILIYFRRWIICGLKLIVEVKTVHKVKWMIRRLTVSKSCWIDRYRNGVNRVVLTRYMLFFLFKISAISETTLCFAKV